MKMRKEDKAALVDEIADRLGDAEAIFAVDYRGITVPQAAELRAKLTEADTTFRVVKNRLAKRATERAGTAELDPLFEGPTALALVKGDAVAAAKAISTFGRQHDILEYKGGLMDGAPLDPDQFTAIARLPGLDVLRGQLVASWPARSPGSPAASPRCSPASPSPSARSTSKAWSAARQRSRAEEPEETRRGAGGGAAERGGEPAEEPEPSAEAAGGGAKQPPTRSPEPKAEDENHDDGSEAEGSDEVKAEGETPEEEER